MAVAPGPSRLALTVPECGPPIRFQSEHSLELRCLRGQLESFTLGRKRLIARSTVEDFIASGGTGSEDEGQ